MSITSQISYSCSTTSSQSSLAGTDNETGNTLVDTVQNFAASSSNVAVTLALTVANLQSVFLLSDRGGTLTTNGTGTADVQTITITGTPTSGSFPLHFGGQVTSVAYNASSSDIQTALRALSTIGGSNVTCSGGALPGTPVVVTFAGTLNTKLQTLMTTYSGSLGGGSAPAVSIAHTTSGKPSNTIVLAPGIPFVWAASQTSLTNCFTVDVTSAFYTCTTAGTLKMRIVTS